MDDCLQQVVANHLLVLIVELEIACFRRAADDVEARLSKRARLKSVCYTLATETKHKIQDERDACASEVEKSTNSHGKLPHKGKKRNPVVLNSETQSCARDDGLLGAKLPVRSITYQAITW
jgi:hypothetical protein